MKKSILYSTVHLEASKVDEIISQLKRSGYAKVRKVDKVEEDGKTFYRIRVYR